MKMGQRFLEDRKKAVRDEMAKIECEYSAIVNALNSLKNQAVEVSGNLLMEADCDAFRRRLKPGMSQLQDVLNTMILLKLSLLEATDGDSSVDDSVHNSVSDRTVLSSQSRNTTTPPVVSLLHCSVFNDQIVRDYNEDASRVKQQRKDERRVEQQREDEHRAKQQREDELRREQQSVERGTDEELIRTQTLIENHSVQQRAVPDTTSKELRESKLNVEPRVADIPLKEIQIDKLIVTHKTNEISRNMQTIVVNKRNRDSRDSNSSEAPINYGLKSESGLNYAGAIGRQLLADRADFEVMSSSSVSGSCIRDGAFANVFMPTGELTNRSHQFAMSSTAEHAYEELPRYCITENSWFDVLVTVVNTPWMFWAQPASCNNDFEDFMEKFALYNEKLSAKPEEAQRLQFIPTAGMLLACLYSADNAWYRARVVKVHRSLRSEKIKVSVIYVDYGNHEVVSPRRLRPLDAQFRQLPGQAFICALSKVGPVDGSMEWPVEINNIFHTCLYSASESKTISVCASKIEDCPLVFLDIALNDSMKARLGSSQIITNTSGDLSQHMCHAGFARYLPDNIFPADAYRLEWITNYISPVNRHNLSTMSPHELHCSMMPTFSGQLAGYYQGGGDRIRQTTGCVVSSVSDIHIVGVLSMDNKALASGEPNGKQSDCRNSCQTHSDSALSLTPGSNVAASLSKNDVDDSGGRRYKASEGGGGSSKSAGCTEFGLESYISGAEASGSAGVESCKDAEGGCGGASYRIASCAEGGADSKRGGGKSYRSAGRVEGSSGWDGHKGGSGRSSPAAGSKGGSGEGECVNQTLVEPVRRLRPVVLVVPENHCLVMSMSSIESPGRFWVHVVNETCSLLDEVFMNLNNSQMKWGDPPGPGSPLFIRHSGCVVESQRHSRDLFRAEVLEVTEEMDTNGFVNIKVHVLYIDYGDDEWVDSTKIREMPEFICTLPPLAMCCCLGSIEPKISTSAGQSGSEYVCRRWSSDATNLLKEFCPDMGRFVGRIQKRLEPGSTIRPSSSIPLELTVCVEMDADSDGLNSVIVNNELVSRGYAQFIDTSIAYWDPMAEEYLSTRNSFQVETEDPGVAAIGYKAKDEERICRFYQQKGGCWRGDLCLFEHVARTAITSDKKPVVYVSDVEGGLRYPSEGTWTHVRITTFRDPSCFYVIFPYGTKPITELRAEASLSSFHNEQEENIRTSLSCLTEALNVEYSRKVVADNDLTAYVEGQIVVARFKRDERWHRARVINSGTTTDNVEVYSLDYGYREWVGIERLRTIERTFMHLPFQSVRCRTLLVSTAEDGQWYPEVKNLCESLLKGKILTAQILYSGVDIYVDLFDGETEPSSVFNILIERGLANRKESLFTRSSVPGDSVGCNTSVASSYELVSTSENLSDSNFIPG